MVSCIKIETASLIFAILGLLTTFGGTLTYCVFLVRLFIGMTNLISQDDKKSNVDVELWMTSYSVFINVTMTIMLSILVIGLVFSIILMKGLLSKNSHLVKAYFVYGVTGNTFSIIFGLFVTINILAKTGLLVLLGSFVYCFILAMIKKTYLKLATNERNQSSQKDVVAEKSISIKL